MRLLKTATAVFLLLITVTSCQKDEIENTKEESYTVDISLAHENDSEFSEEVLNLINEHRSSIGLNTLINGTQESSAYAVDHTNYMISISQINHHNFPLRAAALENNGAESVGENVAQGFNNAEAVVNAWLNSASHKANIEGSYTHTGFGIKYCDQTNTYYFTQLFYRM